MMLRRSIFIGIFSVPFHFRCNYESYLLPLSSVFSHVALFYILLIIVDFLMSALCWWLQYILFRLGLIM